MTREQRRFLSWVTVVGVCLFLSIFLWNECGNSSYTLPKSVIDHNEPLAYENGGTAVFTMKVLGLDAGKWDMRSIANDMQTIVKHEVDENHSEGSILFKVVGESDDRYGNTNQIDAFSLQFSMDDLKQINWSNFYTGNLLNLGKIVGETGAGELLIDKYCDADREESEYFCAVGTAR